MKKHWFYKLRKWLIDLFIPKKTKAIVTDTLLELKQANLQYSEAKKQYDKMINKKYSGKKRYQKC